MSMIVNSYRFLSPVNSDPVIAGSQRHVENDNWFGNTVNSDSPNSGDLIILHLAHGSNLNTGLPITWPAGFTVGAREVYGRTCGAWAWKIAEASEPATYSVSWGGTGTRSVLSLVRFSVHNGIAGYSSHFTSFNVNSMVSPGYTSTPATSKRITFFSFGWGGGTMTATPDALSPPVSVLHPPLFTTEGDFTWCCGQMTLTRDEPDDIYPSFNTATSWTLNANGVRMLAFTIAVRRP